jgi:hypothetical protein
VVFLGLLFRQAPLLLRVEVATLAGCSAAAVTMGILVLLRFRRLSDLEQVAPPMLPPVEP